MALPALLAPVVSFLLREVIVKFAVFTGVFALVAFMVPLAVGYLGGFVNAQGLTTAFGGIAPGVWFWVDAFGLGFGLPLVISAYVARFLIRRLPVIG